MIASGAVESKAVEATKTRVLGNIEGSTSIREARATAGGWGKYLNREKITCDRGVYFFGEDVLPYINRQDATLGRDGYSHFFMSLDDAKKINSVAMAARESGMAPSVQRAYVNNKAVFGVEFPLEGLGVRIPTVADSGGWPHYLPGGYTAVRMNLGESGGFLVNSTKEFVISGGTPIPKGSILFKLGNNGERIFIRRF